MTKTLAFVATAIATVAISSLVVVTKAKAHEAPTGWSYGRECCSSIDCRKVPASYVRETPDGYVLTKTGETLSYGDSRVKDSKDNELHWCTIGGRDTGRTICLYVPLKGY